MLSLSDNNKAVVIKALNTNSRYLDDLLNIYQSYNEKIVSQIYHSGLQLNRANSSITDAPFLDLVTIFGLGPSEILGSDYRVSRCYGA